MVGLALLTLVLVGALGWRSTQPSELVYQGKPLSAWLRGYDSYPSPDTDRVVRAIGTNAIPKLLRMLRQTDSPIQTNLLAVLRKLHIIKSDPIQAKELNREASLAFRALGTQAAVAVPDLIRIFDEARSPSSQRLAALALGDLGSAANQAVPRMLQGVTNADASLRWVCLNALFNMELESEVEIAVLTNALRDPFRSMRIAASGRLLAPRLRKSAVAALPGLQALSEDPDPDISNEAVGIVRQLEGKPVQSPWRTNDTLRAR